MGAPFLQHFPVVGDLVLPLLRRDQIVGIDVFEPDEDAAGSGPCRLLDEVGNLVAERIDLNGEPDVHALLDAQFDHAVKQRFPVVIAGEIVVGNEESLDALGVVRADRFFEVVGRAIAALATLNIDDGAEGALVGAAPAQIDARHRSGCAADVLTRQDRRGLPCERRKMVHVVVERCQGAVPGIAQDLIEPTLLRLAGEEGNAERLRLAHILGHLGKHGDAAGNVEAADANGQSGSQEGPGEVNGAGKLI